MAIQKILPISLAAILGLCLVMATQLAEASPPPATQEPAEKKPTEKRPTEKPPKSLRGPAKLGEACKVDADCSEEGSPTRCAKSKCETDVSRIPPPT